MTLVAQLNTLQQRLSDGLRLLPGATALYLHGSRARGHADGYADLDLQVYTQTQAARAVWPQFLERIAPLEAAWPLNGAADNTAYTVFIQGESYYHKVDISLNQEGVDTVHESCVRLWAQPPTPEVEWAPASAVYLPVFGSLGHQVLEELFASERYVKARKRGQDVLCWRFMRVKPDRWLQLHYAQSQAWQAHDQPLTTWELKALDSCLTAYERAQFTNHLDWSDALAMDAAMLWFTEEILRLLAARARMLGDCLPVDLVERHVAFMRDELGS